MMNIRSLSLLGTLCFLTVQIAVAQTLVRSDYIITMAADQIEAIDGYMLIDEAGKIVELAAGEPPAESDAYYVDAIGKIVLPGFVSGHNHLWQSAFRGRGSDKELYGWIRELHGTFGRHFERGDMYAFTLYGALDQLANGITTTLNHSQNIAPTYADYIEQFTAGMDAGQHFVFSYVLDRNAASPEERRAKLVDLMEATAAIEEPHPCLGFGLHGMGVHFSIERHQEEVALAKEFDLDMQIHYLEEKAQSYQEGQAKFVDLNTDGGVWDGLVYAHFVHPTEDILQISIDAGAKMIWNPLSNGRLASGLADIPKYQAMGLEIGMGVDGAGSADICDPFQNMRMGMYALRMRDSDASVMSCYQVLSLHTIKTAEVLEVADRVGSLEVGKLADFLIVEPESPVFDPYATLVLATSASDIESVWVRGVKQVDAGELLLHEMAEVKKEVAERVDRIAKAAGVFK